MTMHVPTVRGIGGRGGVEGEKGVEEGCLFAETKEGLRRQW